MRWFVLLIGFLTLSSFNHEFYVSICQIDHNPQNESLEITFKIFTDNLEEAIRETSNTKCYLDTRKEIKEAKKFVGNYLTSKMEMSVNGQEVEFDFLGMEYEADATWCYIEVKNIKEVKSIEVINSLLIEVYEKQTNIIHYNINNQKKSSLLNKRNKISTHDFE